MVPAVKPAGAATRAGRVAVLATAATIQAAALADLVHRFAAGIEVQYLPAPGLADRVECGDLAGPQTAALLARYLAPARASGADVVVLGCTHYVFLRPLVQRIMGNDVTVLDTSEPVAQQVERLVAAAALRPPGGTFPAAAADGPVQYVTSGDPRRLAGTLVRLRAAGVPVPPGPVLGDDGEHV